MGKQEWSHIIKADDVENRIMKLNIAPSESEKPALCRRLGIASIEKFEARVQLRRNPGNMVIHIEGRIQAEITQKCVVTLEPVEEKIDDSFEAWYADPHQALSFAKAKRERESLKDKGEQPVLEEMDDPEPVIDGKIDLGELVSQHFSLMLNPYPRKQGAEYGVSAEGLKADKAAEEIYHNPFAALKDWKAREGKKDH